MQMAAREPTNGRSASWSGVIVMSLTMLLVAVILAPRGVALSSVAPSSFVQGKPKDCCIASSTIFSRAIGDPAR